MSKLPFIDCQGLAGHWTLGTVQTGTFELVHRVSLPGGFGDPVVDGNRDLIGYDWEQEVGQAADLEGVEGAYLAGTPPCSGFSLMNVSKGKNARGSDSAINNCMKELIRYAAKCRGTDGKTGPEVVAFESVQQAFTTGRDLMQHLRALLEELTGQQYGLHHVKMSGSSIGAAQMRHRYFFVAARIPFGVDPPDPRKVVTYADAIDDLRDLAFTWDAQPYRRGADTEFQRAHRTPSEVAAAAKMAGGVTAHIGLEEGRVLTNLIDEIMSNGGWEPGENLSQAIARSGNIPERLRHRWNHEENRLEGWGHPARIRPDRPGYVLTGGSVGQFIHYAEPRLLTVRECTRLMGLPDAWSWSAARSVQQAGMFIGKCCPVQSGRWISEWVARALRDEPGDSGTVIGEREYLTDCTNDYKSWDPRVSGIDFKRKVTVPVG